MLFIYAPKNGQGASVVIMFSIDLFADAHMLGFTIAGESVIGPRLADRRRLAGAGLVPPRRPSAGGLSRPADPIQTVVRRSARRGFSCRGGVRTPSGEREISSDGA